MKAAYSYLKSTRHNAFFRHDYHRKARTEKRMEPILVDVLTIYTYLVFEKWMPPAVLPLDDKKPAVVKGCGNLICQ
jgi:hypothetical protein